MDIDKAYDLTDALTAEGFIVPGKEEDVENFLKDFWFETNDEDEDEYSAQADWKTSMKRVMNMEPEERQVVLDFLDWELNDIIADIQSHTGWGRDEIIEHLKKKKDMYDQKSYESEAAKSSALLLGGVVGGIIICSIIGYYMTKANKEGKLINGIT